MIDLYKQNVWVHTPEVKLHDFLTLKKLVSNTRLIKKCDVIGAFTHDGAINAGAVFFRSNKKIILIFSSSNKVGRKNNAMRFIIDRILRKYSESELIFDFEGSSIKTIESFNKSFGPEEINFTCIRYSKFALLKKLIDVKHSLQGYI